MQVNLWIALRNGAHVAIKERIKWNEEAQGPYTGAVPNWVARFFAEIADRAMIDLLFRTDRVWFSQGAVWRDWSLWSLNFDENKKDLLRIKQDLDDLELQYPGLIRIVGAWWWETGLQVGTRLVDAVVVGTPIYPIDSRLIEFMPDNADSTRPTEVSDVNVVYGQEFRRFS